MTVPGFGLSTASRIRILGLMPCGTAGCREAVKAGVGASMRAWTRKRYGPGGIMFALASTLTISSPASFGAGFGRGIGFLVFAAVFFAGFAFLAGFAFFEDLACLPGFAFA